MRLRNCVLRAEKGTVRIFPPVYAATDNEMSLCVLFDTEKCDILITGDRNGFGGAFSAEKRGDSGGRHFGSRASRCQKLHLSGASGGGKAGNRLHQRRGGESLWSSCPGAFEATDGFRMYRLPHRSKRNHYHQEVTTMAKAQPSDSGLQELKRS